jgi:hypothetical protein
MPTEKVWLHGHDAIAMAAALQGQTNERKLRLIAAACCRQLEGVAGPDYCRAALTAAEQFAEGTLALEEFDAHRHRLLDATAWVSEWADETPEENAVRAVRAVLHPKAGFALRDVLDALERAAHLRGTTEAEALELSRQELKRQAAVIREIAGNPFRTTVIAEPWKQWHGGCLVKLATEIYDARAFHDIPLLGDVLEDAGCLDDELLDHCRADGWHALGCWVLDGILGKA